MTEPANDLTASPEPERDLWHVQAMRQLQAAQNKIDALAAKVQAMTKEKESLVGVAGVMEGEHLAEIELLKAERDALLKAPKAGLVEAEHEVLALTVQLWSGLCDVVLDGPSRECDLNEISGHLHAIQQAVLANAAARAHPHLYRRLGSNLNLNSKDSELLDDGHHLLCAPHRESSSFWCNRCTALGVSPGHGKVEE